MRDKKLNLKQEVLEHASRFEFFEAARILRLLESGTSNARSEPGAAPNPSPPAQGAQPGSKLKVRFRSAATKNFPAGEIQKLERNQDRVELYTNVIGLFGPTGVLPHHDKDLVSGGEPNVLLRDFLDIFNTRIITLFFEAWKANRHDILLEMFQRKVAKREDSCTLMLLSVCGLGLSQTRDQHLFPDEVFAASAGLLSRNVRSASAIRRCVANQFDVPVLVREFIGERVFIPRRIQTRISSAEDSFNALGKTAIVGQSVTVHRQRFEIRLGPLSHDEFQSLCPYESTGDSVNSEKRSIRANIAFRRLVDLIKSIQGRPLDFDVRFYVKPEAVLPARLMSFEEQPGEGNSVANKPKATRLGFDSWVVSEPTKQYRDDTVKRFTWDVSS